jgi:glycosyltransferase involved in cell wall biosynthesis
VTIGFVSEDYEPAVAGVGVHLQNLIAAVRQRHEIVVITSRKPSQPAVSIEPRLAVYRQRSLAVSGFHHSVTSTRRVRSLLERHRVDVVHVQFLSVMAAQARRAARQLGAPVIYTYHMAEEIFTSPFRGVPPVQRLLTRALVRFFGGFDLVTFPSAALMHEAERKGLSAPTTLLGNAIAFDTSRMPRSGPAHGRFVLLFVGRLSPEKNLALLIRSFAALVRRHPFVQLHLAGAGPLQGTLRTLVDALGIATHVTFLGQVPNAQLDVAYRDADAFVLPSLFETQGMVCVEAMQFGLPLVVSDAIVSRHELVEHGRNGFIFDHTSEAALLQCLDTLVADPAARQQMGEASLARAASFSRAAVVAAHEALYERLRVR